MELFCSLCLLWSCILSRFAFEAVLFSRFVMEMFYSLGLLWSCILFRFVMELYFI